MTDEREDEIEMLRSEVLFLRRIGVKALDELRVARAALAALLDGLGRDDQPRREAIDEARALVASWSKP